MIYIREIKPLKFSGLSSFLVSFEYDPRIVELIKTVPNHYFHKNILAWEIPINCLSQTLDLLTPLDTITLTLLEEKPTKENLELTEDEITQFRIKPFQHQLEAINFGLKHDGWLLLDSMGLGKTLEIMYYAETLKRRGLIEHALIICGVDSLRQNWKAEIEKFSSFDVRVLGERINKKGKIQYSTISERAEELKRPIKEFFVVVNAATLRNEKIIKVLTNKKNPNQFGLIAVDEIHRCLTADTKIKTESGEYSIKDFIDLKDRPKVLSYNIKTNIDEYKYVEDIYTSKPQEPLIELSVMEAGKIYILKCTESHKIFTKNRGWVKAKNLTDQDDIQILS